MYDGCMYACMCLCVCVCVRVFACVCVFACTYGFAIGIYRYHKGYRIHSNIRNILVQTVKMSQMPY